MKNAVDGFHGVGIDQGEIARKDLKLHDKLEKAGAFDNHSRKIVEDIVDLFKRIFKKIVK
jgi:hypothetical protein